MTDGIERALAAHHRFEEQDDGFVPTRTTFDATVQVGSEAVRVESEVPTLDAVVTGETVAPVVEDGWFETFERRVEDVGGVTKAEDASVTDVVRGVDTVSVYTELRPTPGTAAEDVVAVVSYVEGTWMEGIIPGYDYVDRVQRLRDQARQNAQSPS